MKYKITELKKEHITEELITVLSALSPTIHTVGLKQLVKTFETRPKNIKTFVAISEKQIIGTVTLVIEKKFIHNCGKVAHLEDLVVSNQYRRQGIGAALIEHCIKEAKKQKCYKLILNCTKELKTYYKKCGLHKSAIQMRVDI
jgi:glucosamine-phosphate N-acetyltransferase